MIIRSSLFSLLAFTASTIFATTFFCAKTNQYVQTGDTADTVLARCGKPDKTSAHDVSEQALSKRTVKWVYSNGIAFIMKHNTVVAISVNGQQMNSTTACATLNAIMVGANIARVRYVCGRPSKIETTHYKPQKTKEIHWVYQSNSSLAPTTIVFKNGVVTAIQ